MKKPISILIAIVFILSLQSCYVMKKSNDFFGVETSEKNTLYLIDISGSMEGIDEGSIKDQLMREAGNEAGTKVSKLIGGKVGNILGKQVSKQATKLGAVKRKLIPAIKGLPDGKNFTVFAFEDTVVKKSDEFISANNSTRTTVNLFVEKLKAGGGTDTLEGLKESLATPGVQEIILMSDGLPNSAPKTVLEEIKIINVNKVIIHTIAFGEDADISFMKKLAEENGGTFTSSKM